MVSSLQQVGHSLEYLQYICSVFRVLLLNLLRAWLAGLTQMKWQPHYKSLEQCRAQLLSSGDVSWMLTLVSVVWGKLTCTILQTGRSIAA